MTDLDETPRSGQPPEGPQGELAAPVLIVAGSAELADRAAARFGVRAERWVPGREDGAPLERTHRLAEAVAERLAGAATVVLGSPRDADLEVRALVAAAAAAVTHVTSRDDDATVREVVFLDASGDFTRVPASEAYAHARAVLAERGDGPTVTAVISAWNKHDEVRANLLAIRAQTRPFDEVVLVDNASSDGTSQMVRRDFPEVRIVVMPNSEYGACETFNVGFATASSELLAILDDDVVLTPAWLERTVERIQREPDSTAVVSTKVVEPGMPDSYRKAAAVNTERYMSTFRGCASLARKGALQEAGFYDERLFLYGNERDLTCRLLNLGYRVLQYPGAETFHLTPFGLKMGKRSLYFHARNAWLSMLKYAPLRDLLRMPWLVVSRVLLRGSRAEAEGAVTDAVGTIGIGRAVRETPGAWWVLVRATGSILWNVPYCLKHRRPVRHADFDLPLS